MDIEEIIEIVMELDPEMDPKNLIYRADGRIEYSCEHGVGHTIYSSQNDYTHGCDGCCKDYNLFFPNDEKD
ncbi:hypothetical protein HOA59_00980 [archaeon]|jgi:hypothetical protein|nr:hypothetical protein [archaeon]MBT6823991.1 hypothetical protein [archaeon]MBT7107224.1 hypothetical protein [archaeon]MBT7297145.1 hypothetical protein [archaeon]